MKTNPFNTILAAIPFFTRVLKKKRSKFVDLSRLSTEELLAFMHHETHRIEKAVYNKILENKKEIFVKKRD